MVKDDLVNQERFDEITVLCQETIKIILGFEFAHLGIHSKNEENAISIAGRFSSIFGFPLKNGAISCFSGPSIEIVKGQGTGGYGHIAIRTNHIKRAAAYLQRLGVELDMSTAKYNPSGLITAVYLREEIGGFAVHLLQR